MRNIDINRGVDFERAKERLEAEAGRLYRRYWEAKRGSDLVAIEDARAQYQDAAAVAAALRASDQARIRVALQCGSAAWQGGGAVAAQAA